MFRIIERQGGGGGPEFMSDHPNPGNRYESINREAQMLRVADPIRNSGEFNRIQARLRDMPRARSMQEATRGNRRYQDDTPYPNDDSAPQLGRVAYPSSSYRTYAGGNLFRIAVPDNWRELGGGNEITFAPEGAYGQSQGRFVFTHGVQVGVANPASRYLRQATDQFIQSLAQGNPNLRRSSAYRREYVGGKEGLSMILNNVSDATGQAEVVAVITTMLRNGELFYVVAVAPRTEYGSYQGVFQNIVRSVSLNN